MSAHDTRSEPGEGALAWLSVQAMADPAAECMRLTDLLRSDPDEFMTLWFAHVAAGEAIRVVMDAGLE
jgi:hypothetical protein